MAGHTAWFVDAAPVRFDLLSDEQWQALPAGDRDANDEARFIYHSEMVIVATSTVREVARQGRLLTLINRLEISARRELIVSGLQTTGKTTALKQLGRTHELITRQRHPESRYNAAGTAYAVCQVMTETRVDLVLVDLSGPGHQADARASSSARYDVHRV